MLGCVFDTAQAPTVCLWPLGPSLPQPWRRRGEAPVSTRLSWVPGSPWSLEATLLASPVAPPCHHPTPAVTSRQPPLLRMGTRVRGGASGGDLGPEQPAGFWGIALPRRGCPLTAGMGVSPRWGQTQPGFGKGGSSGSFLLSPPQPDHFVQDPAVLREKAEARRMAFLARKG